MRPKAPFAGWGISEAPRYPSVPGIWARAARLRGSKPGVRASHRRDEGGMRSLREEKGAGDEFFFLSWRARAISRDRASSSSPLSFSSATRAVIIRRIDQPKKVFSYCWSAERRAVAGDAVAESR